MYPEHLQIFFMENGLDRAENGGDITHLLFTDDDATETINLPIKDILEVTFQEDGWILICQYISKEKKVEKCRYEPLGSIWGFNIPDKNE